MTHKGWRVVKPQHNKKLGPVVQNLSKILAISILKFGTDMFLQKLLTFLQQKYQCIWKYLSYNS